MSQTPFLIKFTVCNTTGYLYLFSFGANDKENSSNARASRNTVWSHGQGLYSTSQNDASILWCHIKWILKADITSAVSDVITGRNVIITLKG